MSTEQTEPLRLKLTIDEMIQVAGKEIGMRRRVFGARVARGDMEQSEMDRKIAEMGAVYGLLKRLRELKPRIDSVDMTLFEQIVTGGA